MKTSFDGKTQNYIRFFVCCVNWSLLDPQFGKDNLQFFKIYTSKFSILQIAEKNSKVNNILYVELFSKGTLLLTKNLLF